MNITTMAFGAANLSREEIEGKRVLEVGSRNVNGSYRLFVDRWHPASYLGVDIIDGEGVDRICPVESLCDELREHSFDVVVSTEMLEHVDDWRTCVSNLKRVVAPGGILLVTTRSKGMAYHGWPYDFWRYEVEDFEVIFSDCEILVLEADTGSPGIFIKVRVPSTFEEVDLSQYPLYSIVTGKKQLRHSPEDFEADQFKAITLKMRCRQTWSKIALRMEWYSYNALRRLMRLNPPT